MKNNDTAEEDLNVIIGEEDSELIERLKKIIDKSQDVKKQNKE